MTSRLQTIATRLSETQYEAVRLAADTAELTISEWLRTLVIAQTSPPDPVLQTLLQQVEALRIILLNIILALNTDEKAVTIASLTKICAIADKHKVEHARKLVAVVTQSTQEGVTPSCPSKT
jgi:hypothetical protein